ncbi:F-box/FBD/LRR-repeat protein At1g13570 [Linum grandiflorum]
MDAWSDVKRFGPNLLETNGGLAAVESLSVAGDFYEYLATGDIPNLCTINEPWKKLRRLSCVDYFLFLSLMIKLWKCNDSSMAGFAGYREASGIMQSGAVTASKPYTSGKLTRVEVEMEMVSSTRNEMTLIKWLLNISPMLEEMKIQLSTELSDAEKTTFERNPRRGEEMHRRGCEDRISSLPDVVREHILHLLPLMEAGKTSLLSSKWRNLWMNLQTLVVDDSLCETGKIYRVLSLLVGPLKDFTLSHRVLSYHTYRVLRVLPYQNLENLTIDVEGGGCKLSNRVFSSFSQLKKLVLSGCKFTFSPVSFEGFHRLIVLELQHARFENRLTQLRFKCPLLTTLILDDCGTSFEKHLIVIEEAPNLSLFRCDGCIESLRFQHAPRLKDVTFGFGIWNVLSNGETVGPNLLETNGCLATVESLSVAGNFYKISRFSYSDIEGFNGYGQALGIMRSGAVTASESETRRMVTSVEVEMVKGTRNEMTLIKWLLNISPMLEEMKIQLSTELSDAEKLLISAELNGFRRASNRAQITLEWSD